MQFFSRKGLNGPRDIKSFEPFLQVRTSLATLGSLKYTIAKIVHVEVSQFGEVFIDLSARSERPR